MQVPNKELCKTLGTEGGPSLLAEILRLYSGNLTVDYTIREISRQVGGSYSHVHTKMQEYLQQQYFHAARRGPSLLCSINRQHPLLPYQLALLSAQEYLDWQSRYRNPSLVIQELIARLDARLSRNLHSLIVFGSYAKGCADSHSDLDLLLIVPDKDGADDAVMREVTSIEMRYGMEVNPVVVEPEMLIAMWRQPGMNVAKEAFDHKVIACGAEKFWRMALEAR